MKGQSLFEVVFAIAIAALILVGVVSVATSAVRNSSFSRDNALATRHVQETSEWFRELRDASSTWSDFSGYADGSTYCLTSLASPLPTPNPFPAAGSCSASQVISSTPFSREVILTLATPDIVEALIIVDWTDSQGNHEVRSVTRLTNWRAYPAVSSSFFDNPQPPGSTSGLCQPDPPGGSPSSSCGGIGPALCCRHQCGAFPHWCERIAGPFGSCNGFIDCGSE